MSGIVGLCIIIVNVWTSYLGLKKPAVFEKYAFRVDKILVNKDYKRLVTSGFLHVSWVHLIFNMITLYFFSNGLETAIGEARFLLVYAGSLIGGNLFALFIHRNHADYTAVGASGAISGIVFASIALFPGIQLGLLGLPFYIPGWIYGLLYVLYSIYGIRSQRDHIGHEAHLGGGVIGLGIALAMYPGVLKINYVPVLCILLPSLLFLLLIILKPGFLLLKPTFRKKEKTYRDMDEKYYTEKQEREELLNKILEKIHRQGMDSLTLKEREILKRLSK